MLPMQTALLLLLPTCKAPCTQLIAVPYMHSFLPHAAHGHNSGTHCLLLLGHTPQNSPPSDARPNQPSLKTLIAWVRIHLHIHTVINIDIIDHL